MVPGFGLVFGVPRAAVDDEKGLGFRGVGFGALGLGFRDLGLRVKGLGVRGLGFSDSRFRV